MASVHTDTGTDPNWNRHVRLCESVVIYPISVLHRFEGKTAEVSTKVNDTYLKAHSQTDGVLSYGRMVDLMLADFYSDVTAD